MIYTKPVVVATHKATSIIQMQSGEKRGGFPDADQGLTNNPAYEGDE